MRLIPPVAVPSSSGQIAASLFGAGGESFEDALLATSGAARASLFPSGRAALAHVLSSWEDARRREVVAPAYTCWSVAASIVRAGLEIRLVDVDPDTLDYRGEDLERALGDRTRAVLAAHLFSRTADTARIAGLATAHGARWIDDAAQALPLRATGADATILSFGRGKPLALGNGGAVLAGDWLAPRDTRPGGVLAALKLGVTAILARPAWYRLPQALPMLGIGQTVYDPGFDDDGGVYRWQRRLGTRLYAGREALHARRSRHARFLIEAVESCPGWRVPARAAVSEGPLRLPVLAPSRSIRDEVGARLHRVGVTATPMYPATLAKIPGVAGHLAQDGDYPGAESLVDRLLTLPTYPTLRAADLERIASAFLSAAGESA